jgi:hypothetical protein
MPAAARTRAGVGQLTIALWSLALVTNLAAIQRIYIVWSQHRAPQSSAAVPAEDADAGPQLPPAKPRRGAAPC